MSPRKDPKDAEGRREAEKAAEAERQNVENVPRGADIQDTVGGQDPEPHRVMPKEARDRQDVDQD